MFLTADGLATPIPVLGVELWVDPTSAWWVGMNVASNQLGAASSMLPLPNDPWLIGQKFNAQFFWVGPAAPPPCPPQAVSASNALVITIQA